MPAVTAVGITPNAETGVGENVGVTGARILVVESDADRRGLLEYFLRGEGYEVSSCASLPLAWESLERARRTGGRFSAVIAGANPFLSAGARLPAALHRAYPQTPGLVITARPSRSLVRKLAPLSFSVLGKPFEVERLLTEVHRTVMTGKRLETIDFNQSKT